MSDIAVQASFNSGEWAPSLFARVDIQKYRSGAALLENFFVDYRGGASTRPGTKYIIQAYKQATAVRLIPFQATFNTGYIIEFGDKYVRFIYQGASVVNTPLSITGATKANPCVLTIPGNSYTTADWIFVADVGGMTQLNGRYFTITNVSGNNVTIAGLNGVAIDSTGYGAYTSGGTAASIYTLTSPYAAADLALLKFTQATNVMILTHPSYVPYSLTLITATDWAFAPVVIGPKVSAPTGIRIFSSLPTMDALINQPYGWPGLSFYSYVVTAVDDNGDESSPSAPAQIGPRVDIRNYGGGGTNSVQWNGVSGAAYYNVYESPISYFGVQPPGIQYGFVGTLSGTYFIDDNIGPDYAHTPPVAKNPFVGNGIAFVTVTTPGTYTTVPTVSFVGGSPTVLASAVAQLGIIDTPTIAAGGTGYRAGDTANFGNGVTFRILTVDSSGVALTIAIASVGSITSGSVPGNPLTQVSASSAGTGLTVNVTWGVVAVIVETQGIGYTSAPTVAFSSGSAAATVTLTPTGNGNPSVAGFFQQRLILAAPAAAPETFYMSQPGRYYNFDTHNPIEPDDSITGTLVSGTLNTIKSIVSVPAGMLLFSDKAAWVVNGGYVSQGVAAPVTPSNIVATAQSFIGANDMPPIIANYDILFVQSKGSQVRDLAYNIYFNVFTGTDISLISSHLFYGYTLTEWAWAEQPYFEVWAVRDDGVMLTLTFLKEQEFNGWSHQATTNGSFKSVATITEPTQTAQNVDAVYTVVERAIEGSTVKYIERVAERIFNGLDDPFCVDCGLDYDGPTAMRFQGMEHLAGQVVTGLKTDNLGNTTVITPFTMPISGEFSLPSPPAPATGYTDVHLGIGYTCKLQTMPLEVGEPSAQGKPKRIPYVDIRVNETLGLEIGSSFSSLTPMKDLIQGNVSSQKIGQPVQIVNGLYTGDARTFLDPTYTIPGQYCIQQSLPWPATVLGVFPAYVVGDDR